MLVPIDTEMSGFRIPAEEPVDGTDLGSFLLEI